MPAFPKLAMVGYYLGDMGEMPVAATSFSIIDANTSAVVFQGPLALRLSLGWTTSPVPYQQVYAADFSALTTPGTYQLQVEGLGVSLPFVINDGIAMAWVRTLALGMYEQRSGAPGIGLPWTRFSHPSDHTAPASVPVPDTSPEFAFTWATINSYTSLVTPLGPPLQFPQVAPAITSNETSLYPFATRAPSMSRVATGTRATTASTRRTAPSWSTSSSSPSTTFRESRLSTIWGFPRAEMASPTSCRRPRSRPTSWSRCRTADGGFYFLVYPIDEQYENTPPQDGEAQVVWPKTTSVSAAATAAMAEAGSSPAMMQILPGAGRRLPGRGRERVGLPPGGDRQLRRSRGTRSSPSIPTTGRTTMSTRGRRRPCTRQPATAAYQAQLFALFPNPADPETFRWGWWSMAEGWGNAIRDYAFAASSGRLPASSPRRHVPGRMPGPGRLRRRQRGKLGLRQFLWDAISPGDGSRSRGRVVLFPGPGLRCGRRLPGEPQPGLPGGPCHRHGLRGGHKSGERHVPDGPRPQAAAQCRRPVRPVFPPRPSPLRDPPRRDHGGFLLPRQLRFRPFRSHLSDRRGLDGHLSHL